MIGGAGAPLRASSFLCFHVPPVNKSGLVDARAQRDRWGVWGRAGTLYCHMWLVGLSFMLQACQGGLHTAYGLH